MRNSAGIALIPVLLIAGFAHAEATVGDLSVINSETILLKAKVSRAAAQEELDAKSKVAVGNDDVDAPVVKSVYGAGGKLFATFLYGSGVAMDAKQGDTILGGLKVMLVSVDKVELSKGSKRLQVGFSGTAPTVSPQRVPGMQQPVVGQPFMPPVTPPPVIKP